MKTLIAIAALSSLVILSGCETVSTRHRPQSYSSIQPAVDEGADLFKKGEHLSDEDIERILNYRIKLPEKSRVAILKISNDNYWRHYSNDLNQLNKVLNKNLVGALRQSDQIYDASFLPSMLIPNKRTIPYLRGAAARYQADLLLVYRSSCSSFQKNRILAGDEIRAYCDVEAALLDIRKGIVPFTSVSTQSIEAIEKSKDKNAFETQKKAELDAIAKSLGEIADDLVEFLSKRPT